MICLHSTSLYDILHLLSDLEGVMSTIANFDDFAHKLFRMHSLHYYAHNNEFRLMIYERKKLRAYRVNVNDINTALKNTLIFEKTKSESGDIEYGTNYWI